ncbi:MAG: META domain-containing protein, partial [Paramuribaculum sp.]|nr:META domain-containing protein [Paramuribaculum sp.]
MKRSGLIIAMSAVLMLSTLSGCNIYNKVVETANNTVSKIGNIVHKPAKAQTAEKVTPVEKKVEKKKEEVKNTVVAEKSKEKVQEKIKEKEKSVEQNVAEIKDKQSSEKDVAVEAVIPSDREEFTDEVEEKAYTSGQLAKGIIKGDWAIEMVNGKGVVGEDAPFIKFVPEEGRIYGNNGCNVINGEFKYNVADSTLTFSNLASTMRLCNKEGLTDYEINAALDLTRYYELKIVGDDYYMYLLDGSHREVMSLMHQNFQFLNGTWNVSAINGAEVDEPDMHLVVDVDEGKLHGNTGCNILNGNME